MQRGFETKAIFGLVQFEVSALFCVVLLLGATQPDPPFLAGSVDRFSPGLLERGPGILCYLLVVRKGDDQRPTSAQGIFVNVKLVTRQTIRDCLFQCVTCYLARSCPGNSQ